MQWRVRRGKAKHAVRAGGGSWKAIPGTRAVDLKVTMMGWCVCSCHMQGLCMFTWSSKHWGGKLGLGIGMKVWLDPSKYFSWTTLWICSLTGYLICRDVNFTLVLQKFLWSVFLTDDLKSDIPLEHWGCSKFPSKDTSTSSTGTHWEVRLYIQKWYIAICPLDDLRKAAFTPLPFFWIPWSAEKGICCQLNNLHDRSLWKLYFLLIHIFSIFFLNITIFPSNNSAWNLLQ